MVLSRGAAHPKRGRLASSSAPGTSGIPRRQAEAAGERASASFPSLESTHTALRATGVPLNPWPTNLQFVQLTTQPVHPFVTLPISWCCAAAKDSAPVMLGFLPSTSHLRHCTRQLWACTPVVTAEQRMRSCLACGKRTSTQARQVIVFALSALCSALPSGQATCDGTSLLFYRIGC